MALISSVYTDLLVHVLPLPIHAINSLISNFVLLWWQFREYSHRRRLAIILISYVVAIVIDICSVLNLTYVYRIADRASALENTYYLVLSYYPILLLSLLLAALLQRKSGWIRKMNGRLIFRKNKGMLQVTLLLMLLLVTNGLVLVFHLSFNNEGDYHLLLQGLVFLAILINLFTIIAVIRVIARTREDTARKTQELYIEQISGMFTSIRGQRHDFLNHVQVMYTMLKMNKTAELKDYMADVVKETHDVGEIVHHASPAIAAFVKAKTAVALTRSISFSYELSDRWDPQSIVKMIDIIKIVGNLVNNAFDEVDKLPPEERKVHTVIRLAGEQLELSVANAGPPLTEEQCEQIFQPGYTTKQQQHDGLGLSIVQERVRHYNGVISLHSDLEHGTVFRILLPL